MKTVKKNDTMLDRLLQLSQTQLESMSITRQGTLTMKVTRDVRLPEMKVKGADVIIAKDKITVTKPRRAQPYAGNVSKVVHRSKSSYASTHVRISKDGVVSISLVGTTKSLRDKHDVVAALDLSSKMFAMDNFQGQTAEIEDEVLLHYTKAKKAHDDQEKREVRAWEVREKNDLNKLTLNHLTFDI